MFFMSFLKHLYSQHHVHVLYHLHSHSIMHLQAYFVFTEGRTPEFGGCAKFKIIRHYRKTHMCQVPEHGHSAFFIFAEWRWARTR